MWADTLLTGKSSVACTQFMHGIPINLCVGKVTTEFCFILQTVMGVAQVSASGLIVGKCDHVFVDSWNSIQ